MTDAIPLLAHFDIPNELQDKVESADVSPHLGGVGCGITFKNGWGASVICHEFSYGGKDGLWELAVLNKSGDIDYQHPVSGGDVQGHLSPSRVVELLTSIADTKESPPCP